MEKETSSVTKRGTVLSYVPDYEIKPVKVNLDIKLVPFIPFGSDNLFPQATALFSRSSPVHRGVINSKCHYFLGDGLTTDDKKLEAEIENINFEGEHLNDVASKYFLDRAMGGNGWIEIITDAAKSFLWFNHIDYTKARLSKEPGEVFIHPDWSAYKGIGDVDMVTMSLYPKFTAAVNEYGVKVLRSIVHVKDYEPEFFYYGVPGWICGKDSVLIDLKTNKWNLARLKNAFHTSGFLIVPVKDANEGKEVIDYIEKEHTGEGNQAKLMVLTKSRAQEGEKADATQFIKTEQKDDGSWEQLHTQSLTDILIAHGWFRSLCSLPDNTGFDTHRILNEYAVAQKTIIRGEQKTFTSVIQRIYREQQRRDIELAFINTPPVDDDSYMYVWEVREKRGLDFDPNDEQQQKLIIPQGYGTGK